METVKNIHNNFRKKIGENNYELLPMPPTVGFPLLLKVLSITGQSFGSLGAFVESLDPTNGTKDGVALGEAIYLLCNSLVTKDPKLDTVIEIMSYTLQNEVLISRKNYDTLFTGNITEMMEVLMTSALVHFKPFILGAISGFRALKDVEIA